MRSMRVFAGTALFIAGFSIAQVAVAQQAPMKEVPIKGWGGGSSAGPDNYEFGTEQTGNTKSAFIASKIDTPAGAGILNQNFLADDYRGKRVRLSARVKTADAASAELWMRVDGAGNPTPQ